MSLENTSSKDLQDLLASNIKTTLKFWHENLEEICARSSKVDSSQIFYVSHFLARASLVSTTSEIYFPTFSSLIQIYDVFLHKTSRSEEPSLMEIAGCQMLLFSGFYDEYAKKHYNKNDLCRIGAGFFAKSAVGKRKNVLSKMSVRFGTWQDLLAYLRYRLEEQRLLIEVKKDPEPLIKIIPD